MNKAVKRIVSIIIAAALSVVLFSCGKTESVEEIESSDYEVGDVLKLGAYEQDNNEENGKEPIEWIVLDKNGTKLFVMSRYALDSQSYNQNYAKISWETCSLRKWLNGTFLTEAFNDDERAIIKITTVVNEKNAKYGTLGGENTQDKIFLLSIDEAKKLIKDDKSRICAPTDYAIEKGAYVIGKTEKDGGACWWWLRSPGNETDRAAYIFETGQVVDIGNRVYREDYGIRPVMWITQD